MKWKTLMVTATLSSLLLAACGTDNANDKNSYEKSG